MSKYDKCIKEIPVQKGLGSFALGAVMEGAYLGVDSVSLRYGLIDKCGMVEEETDKLHVHNYDQIILFLGNDPKDLLTLGAEVEVTLGEDLLRQRFDVPYAIVIPKGMPHFSPVVNHLDEGRKLYYLAVNGASTPAATVVSETADRCGGEWGEFYNPYRPNLQRLNFCRKGSFFYGSAAPDPASSVGTFIDCRNQGIGLNVSWDVVSSPQHLGPNMKGVGYRAHMHPANDELLIFFSLDEDNLTDLHAEADFCFGKKAEREHHSVTRATVMVNRAGNFHLPLDFLKVDHPLVFSAISSGFQNAPDLPGVIGDDS